MNCHYHNYKHYYYCMLLSALLPAHVLCAFNGKCISSGNLLLDTQIIPMKTHCPALFYIYTFIFRHTPATWTICNGTTFDRDPIHCWHYHYVLMSFSLFFKFMVFLVLKFLFATPRIFHCIHPQCSPLWQLVLYMHDKVNGARGGEKCNNKHYLPNINDTTHSMCVCGVCVGGKVHEFIAKSQTHKNFPIPIFALYICALCGMYSHDRNNLGLSTQSP